MIILLQNRWRTKAKRIVLERCLRAELATRSRVRFLPHDAYDIWQRAVTGCAACPLRSIHATTYTISRARAAARCARARACQLCSVVYLYGPHTAFSHTPRTRPHSTEFMVGGRGG